MQVQCFQRDQAVIVGIVGRIDFNGVDQLREALRKNVGERNFVVDMSSTQFVGSIALTAFFQSLAQHHSRLHINQELPVAGASVEFQRLFSAFEDNVKCRFYKTVQEALSQGPKIPQDFI